VPKLRIIYDVPGWAYHRRALNLQRWAPDDFEVSLAPLQRPGDLEEALGPDPVDIVFVIPTHEARMVRRSIDERGWKTRLVGSWNAGWPLQLGPFYRSYGTTDAMVVNNRIAWERSGQLPRAHLLPNGVDLDTFRVQVPVESRTPKVLWVGSQLRRKQKGYDRIMLPLQESLRREGIDCELLLVDSYDPANRSAEQMADWYNEGTVLVCASTSEGTPNTALEAAACGCTVVSTPVGNMPELIRDGENGYLVQGDPAELLLAVRRAVSSYPSLAHRMQEDIRHWSWRRASAPFYRLFRTILEGPPAPPTERVDLRDQLTVFCTGTEESSLEASLVTLEQQDCLFRLENLCGSPPEQADFPGLVERCRTPFFLQLDQDTALFPSAVGRLFKEITGPGSPRAWVAGPLHDVLRDTLHPRLVLHRHTAARAALESAPHTEREYLDLTAKSGSCTTASPPQVEDALGLIGIHGAPQPRSEDRTC